MGFGGSGELQGRLGGTTADCVLQADEAALYTKLTEEEKQRLTRIVQKSELAKNHVPQRGKGK